MIEYKNNNKFNNLFFSNRCYEILKKIILEVEKNYSCSYQFFNKELNKNFDNKVCNFLYNHKIENIWDHINTNAKTKKQFMLFFHQWFDAFSIIKLLKNLNGY